MEISFWPAIEAAFAGDETNFVGRRSVGGFAAHRQAQRERLRPVENWRGFFCGPVVQWCSRLAGINSETVGRHHVSGPSDRQAYERFSGCPEKVITDGRGSSCNRSAGGQ
jgi:hypothetical protein